MKKRGPPKQFPRTISVRLDQPCLDILDAIATQKAVNRAEALRHLISNGSAGGGVDLVLGAQGTIFFLNFKSRLPHDGSEKAPASGKEFFLFVVPKPCKLTSHSSLSEISQWEGKLLLALIGVCPIVGHLRLRGTSLILEQVIGDKEEIPVTETGITVLGEACFGKAGSDSLE